LTAQLTDRVLTAYRIGDPDGRFPIFDDEGARLFPGRWNTERSPVVYASERYSTAMLEKLVHASGIMPPNQHYITISIPNGTSYEMFQPERHPSWADENDDICKAFGDRWYAERRSAVLIVPSIPARIEQNFIINRSHPHAAAITYSMHQPIWWDERLYGAN
jgi:RES domain-containing protein